MCVVRTSIATDMEVTETAPHDTRLFASIVETTVISFQVQEASAEQGYLSKHNPQAVDKVGGRAFIPFKVNSRAKRDTISGTLGGRRSITSTN